MSFSHPTAAAQAAVTAHYCAKLPAGEQYFTSPLPEAGALSCPHPCGGQCRLQCGACPTPPPLPAELAARLHLSQTLLVLVQQAVACCCQGPGQQVPGLGSQGALDGAWLGRN